MDRIYIACGISAGFIVGAFFLAGGHHEVKHRFREWRHGGYLL